MHELAIAQQLIETSSALLPANATSVAVAHIQLGALAGVSEDELRFGFEAMSPNTPFAGTKLEINFVPAVVHCPQCGIDFTAHNADELLCATCGFPAVVLQGKELLVTSLEVNVPDANAEDNIAVEEVVHG